MLLNLRDKSQNSIKKAMPSWAVVLFVVLGAFTLTACSHNKEKPALTSADTASPQLINTATREDIKALLHAEFTLQREGPNKAYELFYKLASQSQDVVLIERLTYIALVSQNDLYIERSANLWLSVDATSDTAYALKLQSLVNSQRLEDVTRLISAAIQNDAPLQFLPLYLEDNVRHNDHVSLLESAIAALPTEQKNHPYIQLSQAHLLLLAGEYQEAIAKTEQLLSESQIEETESIYLIQAFSKKSLGLLDEAIGTLQEASLSFPNNAQIMTPLLAFLVENEQVSLAAQDFIDSKLNTVETLQVGINLMQTLLEHKHAQWLLDIAATLPEEQLGLSDQIFYLKASALAQLGQKERAITVMQQVTHHLHANATNQIALWLYEEGQQSQINAMVLSRTQRENMPEQVEMISQIHEENGNSDLSYELLSQSLEALPESDILRYRKALLADSLGLWKVTEKELHRLLQKDPNNPHYLNALGYTLLTRTDRIDEAMVLIESAYEKADTDPAIIDSLGWGLFLKGELEQSSYYLKKAWKMFPDAEIAAHYGESLWAQRYYQEAIKVWQSALDTAPDDPVLLDTIKRLSPSLLENRKQDTR